MAKLTNDYPSWGDSGTAPASGTDYAGGDNPKAGHYDMLWDRLNKYFDNHIANLEHDGILESGSGVIDSGDAKVLHLTELANNDTLYVTEGTLAKPDAQPIPSGVDLIIATLDGAGTGTSRTTLIGGDGTTSFVKETGSPLGSYKNTSGAAQFAAVMVDNGHFNAGSGSNVDHVATTHGRVQ